MAEVKLIAAIGNADNLDFKDDFPDVDFNYQYTIIDAMTELQQNPSMYQYILISCQSFVATNGIDDEEVMEILAKTLAQCNYTRIVFLDINETYKDMFYLKLKSIKSKGYKSVATQLTYRHFSAAIKSLLSGDSSKPTQPVEEYTPPTKIKESIFEKAKKKREEALRKKQEEEFSKKKEPEKPKVKIETKKEEPKEEPKEEQPKPAPKIKRKEQTTTDVVDRNDVERFRGSSILFTSPCSKVGTTTAAIAFAEALGEADANVCYVQVTKKLNTCMLYMKEDSKLEGDRKNPFSSVASCKDVEPYVGVYGKTHYFSNELYDVSSGIDYKKVFVALTRKFDTVVFDVDFDILMENEELLALFDHKNIVLTNSVDCIATMSLYYQILSQGEEYSILYGLMTKSFNFMLNRVTVRNTVEGKEIKPTEVVSAIVDTDEDFVDIEFLPMLGVVHESNKMDNPFSKEASHNMTAIVKKMR